MAYSDKQVRSALAGRVRHNVIELVMAELRSAEPGALERSEVVEVLALCQQQAKVKFRSDGHCAWLVLAMAVAGVAALLKLELPSAGEPKA